MLAAGQDEGSVSSSFDLYRFVFCFFAFLPSFLFFFSNESVLFISQVCCSTCGCFYLLLFFSLSLSPFLSFLADYIYLYIYISVDLSIRRLLCSLSLSLKTSLFSFSVFLSFHLILPSFFSLSLVHWLYLSIYLSDYLSVCVCVDIMRII